MSYLNEFYRFGGSPADSTQVYITEAVLVAFVLLTVFMIAREAYKRR